MLHTQRSKMNDYFDILERTPLFSGIGREDIMDLLKCAHARKVEYEKGETIIWEGSGVSDIGIVLSGRAHSVKIDEAGRMTIVTLLEKGSFIGVLLAASRDRKSPVTVRAQEPLLALFIPFERIISICSKACPRHSVLLRNCFDSLAEKSLELHERIDCLIMPTVRDKALAYLSAEAKRNGSRAFMAPLDRSAMAAYINVDRSALSRELSNMKRDGLIDYYKNSFKLLFKET